MFQVVLQSAMKQLKSKFKLPGPPHQKSKEGLPKERQDRTGFILILAIGGAIFLLAIFSNLP